MSTFVLVHGAWQSHRTWDLLAPLLGKRGHRVITPVLSGLGTDQARLSRDITLLQHVEDVSVEVSKCPDQVILVGHSYAGMIISGVVETNPAQVQRLVFLDAFIPEDGQSALDLLPPEIGTYFRGVARDHGDGWRLPGGEGQLDLWGLKPGEARDFVRARLCDFSLRCFEEHLHLPANRKAEHSSDLRCQRCGRISCEAVLRSVRSKSSCVGLGGRRTEDGPRQPCRMSRRRREHLAVGCAVSMSKHPRMVAVISQYHQR